MCALLLLFVFNFHAHNKKENKKEKQISKLNELLQTLNIFISIALSIPIFGFVYYTIFCCDIWYVLRKVKIKFRHKRKFCSKN